MLALVMSPSLTKLTISSHTTTSVTPSEQDRTPVVQETLPTVEQDSETVAPLPEPATTHYPSRTRKPPVLLPVAGGVFQPKYTLQYMNWLRGLGCGG